MLDSTVSHLTEMLLLLLLSLLSLTAGQLSEPTISCSECLSEMESLGELVSQGSHTIQQFLISNYCPGLAGTEECEDLLVKNYVPMLELVVQHYFVQGANHICSAWGVCGGEGRGGAYTCSECVEGLEWVGGYLTDPLWVAEYSLYLQDNFCPSQAQPGQCEELVRLHFPPMTELTVSHFWRPDYLCHLQGVCSSTTASPTAPPTGGPDFLSLVSLADYPLAKCNDGTSAVYYRKPLNSDQDTKKLLIDLQGGGMCVPFVEGHGCDHRCQNNNPLCTAATKPHHELHGALYSQDPEKNPAFHDFNYGESEVEKCLD